MIITISGLTGCGKNTLGELLAKELGYTQVCPTFKDLAQEQGIELMEFQKKAEKDPNIDKKFDEVLKKQASKGNCVVTTWLGPWMVDADLRITLFAQKEIRAQRIGKRDGMSEKDAIKHLNARDDNNRKRYKKIYNIDIDDQDRFDACLNSGKYKPEQLLRIVLAIIKERQG